MLVTKPVFDVFSRQSSDKEKREKAKNSRERARASIKMATVAQPNIIRRREMSAK
jgi:hypothetical protein